MLSDHIYSKLITNHHKSSKISAQGHDVFVPHMLHCGTARRGAAAGNNAASPRTTPSTPRAVSLILNEIAGDGKQLFGHTASATA